MKKLLIGMAMAFLSVGGQVAQGQEVTLDELDREIKEMLSRAPKGQHGGKVITPEIEALMHQRQGGMLYPKTNGKTVLIVDGTSSAGKAIDSALQRIRRLCHVPFAVVHREVPTGADLFRTARGLKTDASPAVLLLVDVPDAPTLAAYPEDAVGVLNVATLKTDRENDFLARLGKEISRLTGLALGGYVNAGINGKLAGGVLSPVFSVKELDAVDTIYLLPLQYNGVYGTLKKLDIDSARPTPYAIAVKQGWAPSPTNAIQRAIWERAQAEKEKGPANAIKIAPPKK